MKTEDIKQLLEKYYEGETSREEEQLLYDYFSKEDVDPELLNEAYIFMQIREGDGGEVPPMLESDLVSLIDHLAEKEKQQTQLEPAKKKNRLILWATTVAACAAILISVMVIFDKPQTGGNTPEFAQDTFTDPNEAYSEAEKALQLIALNLNKGLSKLEESNDDIQKANEVLNNSLNAIKTK